MGAIAEKRSSQENFTQDGTSPTQMRTSLHRSRNRVFYNNVLSPYALPNCETEKTAV